MVGGRFPDAFLLRDRRPILRVCRHRDCLRRLRQNRWAAGEQWNGTGVERWRAPWVSRNRWRDRRFRAAGALAACPPALASRPVRTPYGLGAGWHLDAAAEN